MIPKPNRMAALALVTLTCVAAASPEEREAGSAVQRMLRPVLTAAEAVASVRIERSDPFGGPPERERGRLWLLPKLGIRYRTDGARGQDLVADKSRDAFQIHTPAQRTLHKGPFERAPARLRSLILNPDEILTKQVEAVPERRRVGGSVRSGYRLREGALGDASREWSVWVAGDSKSGLPRWVSVASDIDTLSIEFEKFTLRSTARAADLTLQIPPGTTVESLDARELLEDKGGSRKGETR